MKDLIDIRKEIDSTDKELVALFTKRMNLSKEVAEYKSANKLPVFDTERERVLYNKVQEMAGDDFAGYTKQLYQTITQLSRTYQNKLILKSQRLAETIKNAIECTPKLFPERAIVACQGAEGAYSQKACDKIFKSPSISYFTSFEGVFKAVNEGFSQYGVVPVENSIAGSVNQIYKLMNKYNFSIVASTKLKINHCLLAKKGVSIKDIKEVYSHQQAIDQCNNFLSSLGVKVIPCANTAVAAKSVANSERDDIAALASSDCVMQYALDIITQNTSDNDDNYTTFICIAKNTEIYPGADKTSFIIRLPHQSGSLYNILSVFNALGLNLIKLESRPVVGIDSEFLFYFDVKASVYSKEFMEMANMLEDTLGLGCIKYLGSYREV